MKQLLYWLYVVVLIGMGMAYLLSSSANLLPLPAIETLSVITILLALVLILNQSKKVVLVGWFWQTCFWLFTSVTGLVLIASVPLAFWLGEESFAYIAQLVFEVLLTIPAQIILFNYAFNDALWHVSSVEEHDISNAS